MPTSTPITFDEFLTSLQSYLTIVLSPDYSVSMANNTQKGKPGSPYVTYFIESCNASSQPQSIYIETETEKEAVRSFLYDIQVIIKVHNEKSPKHLQGASRIITGLYSNLFNDYEEKIGYLQFGSSFEIRDISIFETSRMKQVAQISLSMNAFIKETFDINFINEIVANIIADKNKTAIADTGIVEELIEDTGSVDNIKIVK